MSSLYNIWLNISLLGTSLSHTRYRYFGGHLFFFFLFKKKQIFMPSNAVYNLDLEINLWQTNKSWGCRERKGVTNSKKLGYDEILQF